MTIISKLLGKPATPPGAAPGEGSRDPMPATESRKLFHKQITLGNILSISATLASAIYYVYYVGSAAFDTNDRLKKVEVNTAMVVQMAQQQQRQIDLILSRIIPEHADIDQ